MVVGVADRVKTLATQGSDGSFSGVREDDILTAALETPEHRGRVRGVSSSLGWGKGFGEEFAGMYRKKRNNWSDAHDMMDKTFTSIFHALRLSYGPPWAHYLGGYQDRLLGGTLGLPGLRYTAPDGVEHKDYGGELLG
jgi:hypothetical protein